VAVATVLSLILPAPALAWKPYTHNTSALAAYVDAVADGRVTINGREYALPVRVAQALAQYPAFYNAGVIGPDGFPDLIYGQSIIHPGTTATPEAEAAMAHTGAWLRHVLTTAWQAQGDPRYSEAERLQILAFAYGFLTHAAGDLWGHTFVNDFSRGVFPAVREILTDSEKAAIALRHLVVEGYVGDATPGFDGFQDSDDPRDARGPAPGGDVSDDSTPGFPYNAPHAFVYRSLVDRGASTPLPDRGLVIDFFLDLESALQTVVSFDPMPIGNAVSAYDDTVAAMMELGEACDFDPCTIIPPNCPDIINCPAKILELGLNVVIDSFEAFLAFAAGVIEEAALAVLDAYLGAWIDDIQDGLMSWSELGLASTRGLFDPQTRRDLQNDECALQGPDDTSSLLRALCEDGIGVAQTLLGPDGTMNDFILDHILSMLGAPDILGDIIGIIQDFQSFIDDVLDVLLAPFNPLREGLAELRLFFEQLLVDALSAVLGVDIAALSDFLTHPSRWVCLDMTTFDFPEPLGPRTITLIAGGDHARLDGYLNLPEPHHVMESGLPEGCGRLFDTAEFAAASFAAMHNTIVTSKLLLLDGSGLNQVLSDILGRRVVLYQAADNLMTTGLGMGQWLKLIDGDHAWRADGLPRFCDPAERDCPMSAQVREAALDGGAGTFPVWESCVLRPAFRALYADWESGDAFPALGDAVSADPADDPQAPLTTLTRTGAFYDDGTRQFIAADNVFTQEAHDRPADMGFRDDQVGLQRRVYTDPLNPPPFQTAAQNESFRLLPPDGMRLIDVRSEDPCHTFAGVPLPPEPTQTFVFWLDTTPPMTTCNRPPFNQTFDTDDLSAVDYLIADGADGSGVAASGSTIDGFLVLPGERAIANGETLDMYFYYPGRRLVAVTASDNLGNGGLTECAFELHATIESLLSNVDRAASLGAIRDPGLHHSLRSQLEAAGRHRDAGRPDSELRILEALVIELMRQRGLGAEPITADRFIAYLQDLIARGG
jgi:hypothetical protein